MDRWWISEFEVALQGIRENDPDITSLERGGSDPDQTMTDEEWEELGRDISNNYYWEKVKLYNEALDDHKIACLFRGLTKSSSIKQMKMDLYNNHLSAAAVRSMVPFLQNASNLTQLDLDENNIQSEGVNLLLRALSNSPIEWLSCNKCGIESIDVDSNHMPKHLKDLRLNDNNINVDGCRGLAALLQGGDATLEFLRLDYNGIDDDGVEILTNTLQHNTSLKFLSLFGNNGISNRGKIMLLKLVNDISSIKATLQSNHTLGYIGVDTDRSTDDLRIEPHIEVAAQINFNNFNPETAGRTKVILTQLNSVNRSELMEVQGANQSIYTEVNPLQLPEVLALVGRNLEQGELYVALKSSIAGLMSTVNRKQFLKQQRARHEAIIAQHRATIAQHSAKLAEHTAEVEAIESEIAAIEEEEGLMNEEGIGSESRSNKRRRI